MRQNSGKLKESAEFERIEFSRDKAYWCVTGVKAGYRPPEVARVVFARVH